MKRFILGALVSVSLVAALAGCLSAGRGQGPLATFAFLASVNTTLRQNAVGAINEQREPKEILVVVPPGTDLHGLVATLSLGKEAGIAVISSGTRFPSAGAPLTPTRCSDPWSSRISRSPHLSPPPSLATRSWCPTRRGSWPCVRGHRARWQLYPLTPP